MPIINPWLFYLADISDAIKNATIIAGSILMIVFIVVAFICDEDELIKRTRAYIIIGGGIIFVGLLFPKEETCYKMMAASLVTTENIQTMGETATNVVDYIVDSIDQLLEEDKESK